MLNPSTDPDFTGKVLAPSLPYPFGKAVDAAFENDPSATPLLAKKFNDDWGRDAAMLAAAGLTPSGAADTAEASQWLDALRKLTTATYDSVADMVARSTDKIGAVVQTKQYYAGSGHGGAYYLIKASASVDGMADHTLAAGRIAELVIAASPIITQWGAKPNDPTFNNTPVIQAAVAKLSGLATADDRRVLFTPNAVFWMGAAGLSPRVSVLSNVYIWSYYTTFKCAANTVTDVNWNSIFLFGGLDSRIPCHNSGILGCAIIDGNRDNNGATSGDESWHSGLRLDRDAKDLTFGDLVIVDTSCDGILIAQLGFPYDKNAVPTNIKFGRVTVERAFRNGVSLIDFDNITFDYLQTDDTQGTAPQAGLDIEPNYHEARARGLHIGHLVSNRNLGGGLDVLLHNNNDEQSAGTICRIDAHNNAIGINMYTCCNLNILSGVVTNSTSYALYALRVSNIKLKVDFSNNAFGVALKDMKTWVAEPDVNGGLTATQYPLVGIDLSGCTFTNNGGSQLELQGASETDPVTGLPIKSNMLGVNLSGTRFSNSDPLSNQKASVHLTIGEGVRGYNATGVSMRDDALTSKTIISGQATGILSGGEVSAVATIQVPSLAAGASAVVSIGNTNDFQAYGRLSCRPVFVTTYDASRIAVRADAVLGSQLDIVVTNITGAAQSASSIDVVLDGDVPPFVY